MRKNFSWFLLVAALLLVGFIAYDALRDSRNQTVTATSRTGSTSTHGGGDADQQRQKPALKDSTEDAMTPSLVAKAQEKLKERGYYHGAVDGQWGRELNQAVKAFQKAEGLRVSGVLNARTRARLDI